MSEINNLHYPIITGRPDAVRPAAAGNKPQTADGASFQELFERSLHDQRTLTLSRHAQQRAIDRNIALSETDMGRLSEAVGKAEDKGLKDTLVLMDGTAFIVNVPNKVIVTVVDSAEENTVFTNIDGAVLV